MPEGKEGYEFVSVAAHQLRGPIGSIRGYASMILDGDYGLVPDEIFEVINLIFKSADSLNKTVNDFLDTSKMEQGQMRYYLKDFDLVEMLEQVGKEIYSTINDDIELIFDLPNSPTMIHGDKTKLKHVLSNLIDNANKYTEKGKIEVKLIRLGGQALISIKDNGIGIPKDSIEKLFQKFHRAPNATKVNSSGTGLGLYVVKKIIETHKGRVWVESEGEGRGSTFYIELPLL